MVVYIGPMRRRSLSGKFKRKATVLARMRFYEGAGERAFTLARRKGTGAGSNSQA
jgi:hypothetical protein